MMWRVGRYTGFSQALEIMENLENHRLSNESRTLVVLMPLKAEVGAHTLNSHGNYIIDHGKIMELCF